jgi:HEAT repeat protein
LVDGTSEAVPYASTMNEYPGVVIGVEELVAALRDPDPFVRVQALGRAAGEGSVEPVERALTDDYPIVRREAVRALGRIGGARAVRTLLDTSAHDLSAEVREEAVAALGGMLRVGTATRSEA